MTDHALDKIHLDLHILAAMMRVQEAYNLGGLGPGILMALDRVVGMQEATDRVFRDAVRFEKLKLVKGN